MQALAPAVFLSFFSSNYVLPLWSYHGPDVFLKGASGINSAIVPLLISEGAVLFGVACFPVLASPGFPATIIYPCQLIQSDDTPTGVTRVKSGFSRQVLQKP